MKKKEFRSEGFMAVVRIIARVRNGIRSTFMEPGVKCFATLENVDMILEYENPEEFRKGKLTDYEMEHDVKVYVIIKNNGDQYVVHQGDNRTMEDFRLNV
jgi:hypothetical protein